MSVLYDSAEQHIILLMCAFLTESTKDSLASIEARLFSWSSSEDFFLPTGGKIRFGGLNLKSSMGDTWCVAYLIGALRLERKVEMSSYTINRVVAAARMGVTDGNYAIQWFGSDAAKPNNVYAALLLTEEQVEKIKTDPMLLESLPYRSNDHLGAGEIVRKLTYANLEPARVWLHTHSTNGVHPVPLFGTEDDPVVNPKRFHDGC